MGSLGCAASWLLLLPTSHLVPGFAASMGLGGSSKSFAVFQCCASGFSLES